MTVYGNTAVLAVNYIRNQKIDPESAWDKAVKQFTESASGRVKSCPKKAFLGLCENGCLNMIPAGNYNGRGKNAAYALKALKLLKQDKTLLNNKTRLWKRIASCRENGQLDVLFELYRNNMVK